MFEQSVLTERRRPWTMALSVTLQSALVGTVLLVSMLHIERLPDVMLPAPMPPLPRAPKSMQVVVTEVVRTATATWNKVFTAPVAIPRSIAMIVDAPAGPPVGGSPDGIVGMPGSLDYQSASTIITGSTVAPPPPPPPPAAAPEVKPEKKLIEIGGNVLEGKLIHRVIPEYPVLARQARISGVVELLGVVGKDGRIRDLKVISGHPLLIQSALNAVRQWTYSTTYLNGEPVEVMAPIHVTFTLAR